MTTRGDGIVLIGYRAVGKTTVARAVADALKRPFVDIDEMVENGCGTTISDFFMRYGEHPFRIKEAGLIAGLGTVGGRVVATGGGASLLPSNRRNLAQYGFVVFLELDRNEILRRMDSGDRPPLTSMAAAEEVKTLLAARRPYYRALADHQVDARRPVDELVAEIIASHAVWRSEQSSKGERGS